MLEVSSTSRVPGEWKNISEASFFPQEGAQLDSLTASYFCFDKDALSTFGMELALGENFSGNLATDSTYVLVNETTARLMGWENPGWPDRKNLIGSLSLKSDRSSGRIFISGPYTKK